MVSSASIVLYVNPATGRDNGSGMATSAFKTITHALSQAKPGSVIRLATGTYSTTTGEVFPLMIPAGVVVLGNEATKGANIVIEGGGLYSSPTFGKQSIGIRPEGDAQLRGVTVTNKTTRGTGVWIESSAPAIANNTLINNGREGIFATGTANPEIIGNRLLQNAASGIFMARNAKGELRQNLCQKTGYGIAISDSAAPLVADNQIIENRTGIVVSRSARPVLRNNRVERNSSDGVVISDSALPDLGNRQDPGGNVFQDNDGVDLRNRTATTLITVGNQLNPLTVDGLVDWVASEVNAPPSTPLPITIPPSSPVPAPAPVPISAPTPPISTPVPSPVPTPGPPVTGLKDIVGHWAEGFVQGLVARGAISGFQDGTFRPSMSLSRSQYAAVIAKSFNLPQDQPSSTFTDIPANFWAAAAIAKAVKMGFIQGFPDGTFRPDQGLTRVEAIASLAKGLKLSGGNAGALERYGDRAEIPSYGVDAVAIATQRRIVVNYPQLSQLRPMAEINRAEVCTLIYQALVVLLQVPPLRSDYIVNPDITIPSFSDINGHWAEPFIRGLASQGAIAGFGDGTFKPDASMNRAAYAALLGSAFNLPFERPSVVFNDVPSSFWAAAVIDRAYRSRLLSGFEDGSFRPNQPVLRLQVLLSLVSGLKLPDFDLAVLGRYDDQAAIPPYARRSLASATSQRLVVNYPQTRQLNPNREATRGEVAAMVYQAMVIMGRSPSLDSPYIVNLAPVPESLNPSPSPSPSPTQTVIVIDPGHGGTDPGTTSLTGIREKDIVLPIALKTAAALRTQNVRVVLTRADDRAVDLAARVQIATQSNAAVFVSIHGNSTSSGNADANGLETYHYTNSKQGASLAQSIHNSILKSVNIADRRVRSANFYVLRMTAMPSVLVEVGFLSGRVDSANLVNPAYQQQLAEAIALGILQYVQQPQ